MPENRRVQSNGGASNSPVENLEGAIGRLQIQNNGNQDDGAVANSGSFPYRPGEPDCIYFMRTGHCGYGSNCKFNHPNYAEQVQGGQYRGELPERVGQPDCGFYIKTGNCKYGSTCKFHHPRDRHVPLLNVLGLPMREEEKPCTFYMKNGHCKFGAACKFHHPQPPSTGTVFAIPETAAYGSSASSVVPSPGLHYMGGVSALPLPMSRVPYLSGSSVQVPQNYMPVVVSPSQGMVPGHGWNPYLGSMRPVSSSFLGSDVLYNSKNQGESGYSSMLHLLPERPNQPECRQFMSGGSCKYGSDCKYHHPKERIAQLSTNSLGPLGLPMRPGEAVCSYYSTYGLCKYGPTCKFDHPFAGYSYNYGLSYPPVYHPSLFTYQNNSPVVLSSETSPAKSSKVTDWIGKPEAAGNQNQTQNQNQNQNQVTETSDNSSEQLGSPTHPLPTSSNTSAGSI